MTAGAGDDPRGILNPGTIDGISVGEDGVVELHVEQTAPWDGSDHLLLLTQEKLWNYLAYVADGDFAREYPEAVSRASGSGRRFAPASAECGSSLALPRRAMNWRVVVDLIDEPDQRTAELLQRVAEEFRRLGGTMLTRRMPADR